MPELPEVEVICRGLHPHIINRQIKHIHYSGKGLRSPVDLRDMREKLEGGCIRKLSRRAKYLVLTMDNNSKMVIHLGMTGNLGIFAAGSPLKKHDHFCWLLDNGTELRFNDTRRFGAVHLLLPAADQENDFFANVGPEPFAPDCSASYMLYRASKRKQAVKNFIMDGRTIAGIGNIYANEALFRSGIHPARQASSLSRDEWHDLLNTIRKTLEHAIECGGSTISDYVNASGESGYFQMNFQIYGKTGEKCIKCQETIRKEIIGGRASFYCPHCQQL